ncbi:cobalt-precorrin-6A reductase [Sulfitobacter albidus]|uniref:Cobalt-precorrin-6A reductase n=1 Tax=Sulfitobacter albidus TaxID=2829501 RepID=A0A975JD93_9RHOB|nr:cobalt-precorrin-6A reductase [Sulfitobacter albidus]QUJ76336.1 cobalt-precorrin-6A reductase [Sulfitobacter albidus]
MRVLLLGGTTEASALARALHSAGIDTVFSYAGRTKAPVAQPVTTRVGGFGGADGLREYITAKQITNVVDATHPFAARMSWNAHAACAAVDVPLVRFERPAWSPVDGDDWQNVSDLNAACAALPQSPARVFLAIGRMHLHAFAAAPQHRYLLRLVDPPDGALPLPQTDLIIARGPFDLAGDTALMRVHGITHVVAKNAGGTGARAKIDAARAVGAKVIMVDRPKLPQGTVCAEIETVLHHLHASAERGV